MGDAYFNVSFNVWLDAKNPSRAHITSNDPRFTNESGSAPGLRLVATSNVLSADYNPGVYNRIVRAYSAEQKAVPSGVRIVEEHARHIDRRFGLIVDEYRRALRDLQMAATGSGGEALDLPQASSVVNPWVRRLVETFPDLQRASAVLVALRHEDGIAMVVVDTDGAIYAWDGWYYGRGMPETLVEALAGPDPFEDARVVARNNLQYAPFGWALAEGRSIRSYVRTHVEWNADDVERGPNLTTAEPFAFVAVD